MKVTEIEETAQLKLPAARPAVAPDFPDVMPVLRRKSRRRRRLVRFLAWEAIAFVALIVSVVGGTSPRFGAETLTTPFIAGVFVSAAALAIIPVLFFGLPRRHDQLRRYR